MREDTKKDEEPIDEACYTKKETAIHESCNSTFDIIIERLSCIELFWWIKKGFVLYKIQ